MKPTPPSLLEDRLIDFAILVTEVADQLPAHRAAEHLAAQLVQSGLSAAPACAAASAAGGSVADDAPGRCAMRRSLCETRIWLRILIRKGYASRTWDAKRALAMCDDLLRFVSAGAPHAQTEETP
jgi:four helix bundle protein